MSMREAMRERAREIEGAVCVTVCVCGVVRGAGGRGLCAMAGEGDRGRVRVTVP